MQKLYEESNIQAIADAIRAKNGSEDTYKTSEMAEAIEALESKDPNCNGMHIPEEVFSVTGDCMYRFSNNAWNWLIEQHGDKMNTKDVTAVESMFRNSSELEEIPFDINMMNSININLTNIFWGCSKLKSVPYVKGKSGNLAYLFYSCNNLREIPDDWAGYLDFSYINSLSYGQMQNIFAYCYSLRRVPKSLLDNLYTTAATSSGSALYKAMFNCCYTLDEVKGIQVNQVVYTSNVFSDFAYQAYRLKELTFATDDGESPYVVNWKNQTIDLSSVGYSQNLYALNSFIGYNSGITKDKQVYDDATYAALKNDSDWFACDDTTPGAPIHQAIKYSRYNHDSAVNTINSLPDVSAGSGNTIKFKGEAGSKTDGGAINTLTEEEIAVAASRGWTVSMV